MVLQRLRSGIWRDIIIAWAIALALLAGVMQGRAATENAARHGFASPFELCLQSGTAEEVPAHGEHDCDQCRLPGLTGILTLFAPELPMAAIANAVAHSAAPVAVDDAFYLFPEARGPPVAG
jgi:hypothetical protein